MSLFDPTMFMSGAPGGEGLLAALAARHPEWQLPGGIGSGYGAMASAAPQQQQQPQGIIPPQQTAQPGVLDRIGSALGGGGLTPAALLAFAGGTLSGGIGHGLSALGPAMQQAQQQNLQYRTLASTYDALKNIPGVTPQIAQAIAMNPALAQTLMPSQEIKQTGVDSTSGQPTYSKFNPRTGQLEPIASQSAAAGSSATGEEYLATLPTAQAARVKAIVEGREAPPPGGSRAPQAQAMLNMAAQYEPGFDFTKWTQRNATAKDFASGKSAEMVRSVNQTLGHVGDLLDSVDALKNSSLPIWNAAKNAWDTNVSGGAAPNNVLINAHAVADELSKVFKGSGISDAEIHTWESALSPNMSPEQWRGAVGKLMGLLNSSLSALEDKRARGMNTSMELPPLLNQHSRDVLEKTGRWVGGQPLGIAPAAATSAAAPPIAPGWKVQEH